MVMSSCYILCTKQALRRKVTSDIGIFWSIPSAVSVCRLTKWIIFIGQGNEHVMDMTGIIPNTISMTVLFLFSNYFILAPFLCGIDSGVSGFLTTSTLVVV